MPALTVQALFLVSVLAGTGALIAAIAIARCHWRLDVAPYRETYAFSVLRHPASYVTPDWVRSVRTRALVGMCLMALAVGCLSYQLVVDLGAQ